MSTSVEHTQMPTPQDMIEAVKARDVTRVKELLAADPSLMSAKSDKGETPVLLAAFRHDQEMLKALLDLSPALSLFEAAAIGKTARVKDLLQSQPRTVFAYGPDGWTALHLASFFGHRDTVAALLLAGAEVHARSMNLMDNTPLHAAAAGNHTTVIALLLLNGANVREKQRGGHTALHLAVANDNVDAARLIMNKGPNLAAKTDDGKTVLAIANDKKNEKMIELLTKAGATA